MTNYRRNRVPGGTTFFTINLLNRRSALLVDHIASLRDAIKQTRQTHPFHIDAWVVLPDHMHALLTLPENDTDFSNRIRLIKTAFTKSLPRHPAHTPSPTAKRERSIWQRRFWEHTIRDDADYAAHMDYIHFNPVKHAHTKIPAAWPHATFHHAVTRFLSPQAWSSTPSP